MLTSSLRSRSVWVSAALVLAVVPVLAGQRGGPAATQTARPSAGDAVVPFKIQVPDAVLTDLKQRLARARFADEIPDAGWDYGTNAAYLKQLIEYWRDKYDWRAAERRLNQFDQFKTKIDGLDIYFVHQRSKVPTAKPLLLLNGWPSSIEEYVKVIGPLTDPVAHGGTEADAFHVIVPSMPGYGFSDKPRERGYNPERMAAHWAKLMARLGYPRYYTQGSDWGVATGTYLALNDATHVAALHLNGCPGGIPAAAPAARGGGPVAPPPAATAVRPPPLVSANNGYQEIQTTKPQTLGHGLSDSPVGLASWILDKWQAWSDHDGDLEKVYSKDELLTNIMIYWVTNTGTSSARLYYESRHVDGRLLPTFFDGFLPRLPEGRVTVPTGCGSFPSQYDRRGIPLNTDTAAARRSAEGRYNVVYLTMSPRGGHFAALEQPTLWVQDVRAFFREQR